MGGRGGRKNRQFNTLQATLDAHYAFRTTHTSGSLPQSSEAFLSQNLPEAVDNARVSGLPGPRRHLQTCLYHVGRRHQGGRGHA